MSKKWNERNGVPKSSLTKWHQTRFLLPPALKTPYLHSPATFQKASHCQGTISLLTAKRRKGTITHIHQEQPEQCGANMDKVQGLMSDWFSTMQPPPQGRYCRWKLVLCTDCIEHIKWIASQAGGQVVMAAFLLADREKDRDGERRWRQTKKWKGPQTHTHTEKVGIYKITGTWRGKRDWQIKKVRKRKSDRKSIDSELRLCVALVERCVVHKG